MQQPLHHLSTLLGCLCVSAGLLLAGCTRLPNTPAVMPTPKQPTRLAQTIDWQGHRGARGLYPENTVGGMLVALSNGVTTLEMDLAFSKDSVIILSHEPWFNGEICSDESGAPIPKNTPAPYALINYTAAQIRAFDCGKRGHPRFPVQVFAKAYKPTLAQVVETAEAYCKQEGRPLPYYNIETKTSLEWDSVYTPKPEVFVRKVWEEVIKLGIAERVTLQSFDVRTLQIAQQEKLPLRLCLLVENTDGLDANLQKLGFTPAIYSPSYDLVTAELVLACHEKGMLVVPWTVNDVNDMRRLIDLGVDGLISDYPNQYARLPEFSPAK